MIRFTAFFSVRLRHHAIDIDDQISGKQNKHPDHGLFFFCAAAAERLDMRRGHTLERDSLA
jgi:hypothetical protein